MFNMSIQEVDAFGLQQMRSQGEVVLIDVRTDAEFAQGSIQGAKHTPLHMIPLVADQLDNEKTHYHNLPEWGALRPSLRIPCFKGFCECL